MANVPSPVDDIVFDLKRASRALRTWFMRDGRIDEDERVMLVAIETSTDELSAFRLRQQAAEQWVKTGTVTAYTRQNFRRAGAEIVSLERVRAKNVVPFPGTGDGPTTPEAA